MLSTKVWVEPTQIVRGLVLLTGYTLKGLPQQNNCILHNTYFFTVLLVYRKYRKCPQRKKNVLGCYPVVLKMFKEPMDRLPYVTKGTWQMWVNKRAWGWDYSGLFWVSIQTYDYGPNAVTRIPVKKEMGWWNQGFEHCTMSRGRQTASRNWKKQENKTSPRASRRN